MNEYVRLFQSINQAEVLSGTLSCATWVHTSSQALIYVYISFGMKKKPLQWGSHNYVGHYVSHQGS